MRCRVRLRLLTSYFLLLLVDQSFLYAYSVFTIRSVGSGLLSSVYIAIAYVPRVALMLLGGAVSDRLGCGKTLIYANTARVACYGAGCLALLVSGDSMLTLLGVSIALGVIDAFFLPSSQALPRVLADDSDTIVLQSQFSAVQKAAMVLSFAAGTLLAADLVSPTYLALLVLVALFAAMLAPIGILNRRICDLEDKHAASHQRLLEKLGRVQAFYLMIIFLTELLAAAITNYGLISLGNAIGRSEWDIGAFQVIMSAGGVVGASAVVWITGRARGSKEERFLQLLSIPFVLMCVSSLGMTYSVTFFGLCVLSMVFGFATGALSTVLVARYIMKADRARIAMSISVMSLAAFGAAPIAVFICGLMEEVSSIKVVFQAVALASSVLAGYMQWRRIRGRGAA